MQFHVTVNCEVEANDLNDVLTKLANHFISVRDGNDSALISNGALGVEPMRLEKEPDIETPVKPAELKRRPSRRGG
jgi:hypothetical protein